VDVGCGIVYVHGFFLLLRVVSEVGIVLWLYCHGELLESVQRILLVIFAQEVRVVHISYQSVFLC